MQSEDEPLTLRFTDLSEPGRAAVPAAALARALDALQRLTLMLGRQRDGREPGQRFKPSAEEGARFRLVCTIPGSGSYIQPVRLDGATLLGPEETEAVTGELVGLLGVAGREDGAGLDALLGAGPWRPHIIAALERLPPPPGADTLLEVRRGDAVLCTGERLRDAVARLSRAPVRDRDRAAVVGTLERIDFEARRITLRHAASGRELVCPYTAAVEGSLLDHPREPILVFGLVVRDADGAPRAVEAVDHIEPFDESPVAVKAVPLGQSALRPREPLAADVAFDEGEMLYGATIAALDLATFAETRVGLERAILDEVAAAWAFYAREDDARLTGGAQTLKRNLLAHFSEEPRAA